MRPLSNKSPEAVLIAPLTPFNAPLTLKVPHLISGNCYSRSRASNGMHYRTDLPAAEFTQRMSRPCRATSQVGLWHLHRGGQAGDNVQLRRCPSPHTPRCPRSFAIQPTKVGLLCSRSWVGFRVEMRGGSDAPAGGKRRPKLGRRLSPAGRRSPLIASESEAVRLKLHHRQLGRIRWWHRSLRPSIVRACSATSRFRALRAPRWQAGSATLTSLPRAPFGAIVGASRTIT